jgi:hypothetical protein
MQKILYLSLLTFLCFTAFSQDDKLPAKVKVTMSPSYENDKRVTFIRNMMHDKTGNIFLVKVQYKIFGKSELIIEKYNSDLKQKFSKELVINGTEGKDLDYLSAATLDGEPFVFSSYYNKDKDMRYLFISKIEDSGALGKPKKISEFESDRRGDGYFSIHFNDDSSKMLIINRLDTKRKENARFSFVVYDKGLTEVWKGFAEMPFETRDVVLSDFKVDKQDRVYALASVDNDSKSSKDADVIQEIFMYENGTKKAKRYNLNIKGKLITSLNLLDDKNGDLVAVGTYASTKQRNAFFSRDRTSPLGTVVVKINRESGEVGTKNISQFKKNTFDFFNVKESKIEGGKGINYLRLENSWISEDNSINLDLEQNYVVTRTSQSRNGGTTTTYYYYSELAMLVRIGEDGKVRDEIIVPKKMSSINQKRGLEHIISHTGNETYYVYNDSPKNWGKKFEDESDLATAISPETSGFFNTKKKPHVVLCTITPDGKKKYARLFNFKDDDVFLNTEASLKYLGNSVVVVASYQKDFKLVKISF